MNPYQKHKAIMESLAGAGACALFSWLFFVAGSVTWGMTFFALFIFFLLSTALIAIS